MTRVRWMLLLLALGGCGDESNAAGSGGATAGGGAVAAAGSGAAGGAAGGGDVGFASTVLPLMTQTQACNCHQSEPILMAPFSLKPAEAYANLVNVASVELPSMLLVAPGSLNDSYLWHKLRGTQLEVGGSGERMPSNFPLMESEIEVFGRWIAGGAPP